MMSVASLIVDGDLGNLLHFVKAVDARAVIGVVTLVAGLPHIG